MMALLLLVPLISIALGVPRPAAPSVAPRPGAVESHGELEGLLRMTASRLAVAEASSLLETETEEDLDRRGKTTAVRICKSARSRLPDGTEHGEVIEAFDRGYLVTGTVRAHKAEWEKQASVAKAKLAVYLELTLPFERSQQGLYRFTAVDSSGPHVRVHFEPAGQRRRLWVGDATLDAATGTILQLLGHPAVLPRFVDYMDVHMEFDPKVATGPLAAKQVIEGSGHFLFFHKRMRYTSVTVVPPPPVGLASGN